MLTAYDFPTARALDWCGLDILLVGDSLSQNELGFDKTSDIDLSMMCHHLEAVARGVENTHVLADLPYHTYETPEAAVLSARVLIDSGAKSVKLEGPRYDVVRAIRAEGIDVMGHVGLLPQTARRFVRQGTKPESAVRIARQAAGLEKAGCYAVVLEFMSVHTAREITELVGIPTIGIGAGEGCDGQVLVITDMLGMHEKVPSFVKKYASFFEEMVRAASQYRDDVKARRFPGGD